jgi:plastocyanin
MQPGIPILLLMSSSLAAASVEGTITFDKSAPAGILAWVPGVTRAAVTPAMINQKDKIFIPSVIAARPGTAVTMRNSDDIQHNAYANDKATGVAFDSGLNNPGSDTPVKVDWPVGTVLRLGCKIHPAMQVWIASLDTDAWVVPAAPDAANPKSLAFSIADVPANAASLVVWTSKYGQVEVRLAAGTAVTQQLGTAEKPAGQVSATLKP